MKRLNAFVVPLVLVLAASALAQLAAGKKTYRSDNAVVHYSGVSDDYAKAFDRIAETARAAAIEDFGFDMPESISIEITTGGQTRLFTDGAGFLNLTIDSEKALHKPSESGVFNIYGVCHEIGHIAMYRPITDQSWMTTAAAEGWAHYLGSRLVDVVYKREGANLWPDRYDYRSDGGARLAREMKSPQPSDLTKGAALWQEFVGIVGDKGVAPVFSAWGKAAIDPGDPGAALRKALLATNSDARLGKWWNKAEPLFIERRPKSSIAKKTVDVSEVSDKPTELSKDDGTSAGMRSMAGTGHAVRFEAPDDNSYLTAVKIYGSRYGYPQAPAENFHVWLCDDTFKSIADFPQPYSSFERGDPTWVTLSITPTKVPRKFIICIGFSPTQTKGVMVHHDKKASGNSFMGLPGKPPRPFDGGDWMLRAVVSPLK